MIDRLAYMHDRTASGVLSTRDHLLHRALVAKSAEEKDSYWKSGGGGLFAETGEFCSQSPPPEFEFCHTQKRWTPLITTLPCRNSLHAYERRKIPVQRNPNP